MDNITTALLEGAFREYEDKQRLNLEVLRTMIQMLCKKITADTVTNTKTVDVTDRIARLEAMITKIHDGEGRIVSKTPILTALSMINSVENEVKHIHLQERSPIQEEQVIDELVLNEEEDEDDDDVVEDAEDAEAVEDAEDAEAVEDAEDAEAVEDAEEAVEEEAVEDAEEAEEAEEAVEAEDAEEETEELELEEFSWKGKTYYKDGDENVYDLNDDGEPEKIGTYKGGKILLD